jgi:hypothetical protein
LSPVLPANTTRSEVRAGVAAYLGGSYVENIRGYQNGPLLSWGLGTVRAGWSARLNLNNFVAGMPAGRGMGAYMIVELGHEKETRRSIAGPPVTNGSGQIIAGGIKFIRYRVTLNVFHMAQTNYIEDAQADIDQLIEAIKQQIRYDRTLGGICTQAGEGRYGIQTREGVPMIDANNRAGTWFQMQFEILTQIIA